MACVGFHALLPSDQAIGSPTFVQLNINTIVFNDGGFFDILLFRWTPPAGLITIKGTCSLSQLNGAAPRFGTVGISKNGTHVGTSTFKKGSVIGGGLHNPRSVVELIDRASGTDFYTMVVRHNSSGGEIAFSDSRLTYFSGAVLGLQCALPP